MNEPTRLTECIKITALFFDDRIIITTPTGVHTHTWMGDSYYYPWYCYPWVSSSDPLCPICGEAAGAHDDENCIGASLAYDRGPGYPRRHISWSGPGEETVVQFGSVSPENLEVGFAGDHPSLFHPICGNRSMELPSGAIAVCWMNPDHPGDWHRALDGTQWDHGRELTFEPIFQSARRSGKNAMIAEAEWDEHCRIVLEIVK